MLDGFILVEHRLLELTVLFVSVLSVKSLILVLCVFSHMYWNAILPLCCRVGLETALPWAPSNRKEHGGEGEALQWVLGDRDTLFLVWHQLGVLWPVT